MNNLSDREVFFIIALLIFAAVISPLRVYAETTEGNVVARVLFISEPVKDWLIPQKYTVTVQIMKSGSVSLVDENITDNIIPTGNIIVDVHLATVVEKSGMSANVEGSVIETTSDLLGQPYTFNSSSASSTVPLPQNNEWHDALTLTCYYDVPPELPFPKEDLIKVALNFNINVFLEEGELDSSSPPDDSVGFIFTITYQGRNVGHSWYEFTIFEQEATPTPSPSPSPAPTPTPTPSPQPTLSPTPLAEEPLIVYIVVAVVISVVVGAAVLMLKKRR